MQNLYKLLNPLQNRHTSVIETDERGIRIWYDLLKVIEVIDLSNEYVFRPNSPFSEE